MKEAKHVPHVNAILRWDSISSHFSRIVQSFAMVTSTSLTCKRKDFEMGQPHSACMNAPRILHHALKLVVLSVSRWETVPFSHIAVLLPQVSGDRHTDIPCH